MLKANPRSWEDMLSFVEFAYNRSRHSATKLTPFEVVYGCNPLTPLDMLPRPLKDGEHPPAARLAEHIQDLHRRTRDQLHRRAEMLARSKNRGRKEMIFQPGDLVWVHLRKERFPASRKSKLDVRADGPFEVLEAYGNNAYKVALPDTYGVHPTFNVADLSPYVAPEFEDCELETGTFPTQGGESDATLTAEDEAKALTLPQDGRITRSRAKALLEATQSLIGRTYTSHDTPTPHSCIYRFSSVDVDAAMITTA